MEQKNGGKMIMNLYKDNPEDNSSYIIYEDEDYNTQLALSKIDEKNLNQIASDINVDYVKMEKTSNIDYKLADIKKQISDSLNLETKVNTYKDIYYYFAIPLVILLIIDFVLKKKKV